MSVYPLHLNEILVNFKMLSNLLKKVLSTQLIDPLT